MRITENSHRPQASCCIMCREPGRLYLRHASVSDMFSCPKCGLLFSDSRDYGSEADYHFEAVGEEPTPEQKAQFTKVFSEGIDTSDEEGNMYPTFGISQHSMESGIFAFCERSD